MNKVWGPNVKHTDYGKEKERKKEREEESKERKKEGEKDGEREEGKKGEKEPRFLVESTQIPGGHEDSSARDKTEAGDKGNFPGTLHLDFEET